MTDHPRLALLEVITDPVVLLSSAAVVTYVNDAAAQLFDGRVDDFQGRDLAVLWERHQAPSLLRHELDAAFADGAARSFTEYYGAAGRWFDVRVFPCDGQLLVLFHDVSALKEAERRSTELADEHERLRRVATAVAAEQSAEDVFRLIAREIRGLVGADISAVSRFEPGAFRVLGADGDHAWLAQFEGAPASLLPGSMIGHMKQIGAALAVADARETPFAGRLSTSGARGVVMVPITVGNRVWGAMLAAGYEPWPRTKPIVERLQRFAELAALAVENTEARASLQRQAATDGTTGLAHSTAFTDRLARQVARSRRDGRAFCLAVLDVDRFKAVNDSHGHALGDEALRLLATCLQDHCRTGDLAGRTGGDEFAMLLVDCDPAQCLAVVERIRQRIASLRVGADVTIRVSAGIAEWRPGLDADTIFRQADDALYWAKANGRDTAWIYDPAVVMRLDPEARRDRVERGHALAALRALARAIDAKDVSTREHAERVAEISLHIARELGWSEDRSALLHEAALLHDVGKIGVPDAILLKPEHLDPAEYDAVKRHAALGAEITEGVLTSEQVLWVRSHHERPDGRGYPDGLVDDEIAEGAAILALADTWDVMTSVRPYSPPKATAAALRECRELVGRQFRADVVAALERLVACQRVGGARAAA